MKKSFFVLYFLLIFCLLYFLFNYTSDDYSRVYFFDVGQGDSALIKTNSGQNILIDGGPDKKISKELGRVMSNFEKQIDLMVLTHPHSDHVAGLNEVIDRYEVKKVAYSGVLHTGPPFLLWFEKLRQKNIPLFVVSQPTDIQLSQDSGLRFLYPRDSLQGKKVDNLNNSSLVVEFWRGKNSFLFMGDAELELETKLLGSSSLSAIQVLKVGHHGSDTSSSEKFLQVVRPDYAVVSVGQDNDFGHPSLRVIKRLQRMGARILETQKYGTIEFLLDEKNLWLK